MRGVSARRDPCPLYPPRDAATGPCPVCVPRFGPPPADALHVPSHPAAWSSRFHRVAALDPASVPCHRDKTTRTV